MINRLVGREDLWLALGLLTLSLSFVVEHYAPPTTMTEFVTGLLLGLSVAANLYGIWQLSVNASAPKGKA